jgi:hypothetical protein
MVKINIEINKCMKYYYICKVKSKHFSIAYIMIQAKHLFIYLFIYLFVKYFSHNYFKIN